MNLLVASPAYYDSRDDAQHTGRYSSVYRLHRRREQMRLTMISLSLTKHTFARVDEMLTAAANHGLVVFLDPIDTCCKAAPGRTVWLQALLANGLAAAATYGKYLGERYKRFDNIVWLHGDDFNTWQTAENDAVVQAVAKAIKVR